jgi:hypothetical protein
MTELPPTLTQVQATLADVHRQITETGMVYHINPKWQEMPRGQHPMFASDFTLRPFARRLCREMRRPFVWLTSYRYTPYKETEEVFNAELTFPRRQFLMPIATPLVLTANTSGDSRWHSRYGRNGEPMTWRSNERSNYRFFFHGNEGEKRMHDWIRMTQTNPAMRAALRLPPL